MKKSARTAILGLALGVFLSGCAGTGSPVPGALYAKVKAPQTGEATTGSSKMGKATCESVLGLFAWGDCSIEMAKQNGGLSTVQYSDIEVKNTLGIYATYTTIVRGQ